MQKRHTCLNTRFFFACYMFFFLYLTVCGFADEKNERISEIFEQGWALEGQMHLDLANLDKAEALYEEAVRMAPDNEEAKWRLGEIIFKKAEEEKDKARRIKMVERTVALAEESIAINPESVGGLYWAGTGYARLADMSGILSALKQVKLSKKYLHQAMETDENNRFAILSGVILAAIYSEAPWPLKDMDQALKLAKWAVEKDPNLTIASLRLGKIYVADGKKDMAKKELERCLAIKKPMYVWDAILYDWPGAKGVLEGIK
ncbi:MAG: tetratricopeptide repeat protein [Proteobacteria bacterium]|nr:tetratricopeptide repeat protein [Pseudomonadota bacterium]